MPLPILVSVSTTANQSNLLLAHFNNSAETSNKKLSSGYLDEGGGFHEELDPTQFKAAGIFYGDIVIKVSVDFTKVASSGVAGWTGGTIGDGYSYSNLPGYWQTDTGVKYTASDLLASLAIDTVDVGIKNVAATDSSTRGRLFERYAMTGDVPYAYNNSGTEASKTAESTGDLNTYYKTGTAVALTDVDSAEITLTLGHDLFFYAYGGAANQDDSGNSVNVKFEAKIA